MNAKTLALIKKLLSLATSHNENEARSASKKAHQLLAKLNLTLAHIRSSDEAFVKVKTSYNAKVYSTKASYICDILGDFFFVKVIINSRRAPSHNWRRASYNRSIYLVGKPHNCEIANYVFDYLSKVYDDLWLSYKHHCGAQTYEKRSYFYGLTQGLSEVLTKSIREVEEETGLLIVEDKALLDFLSVHVSGHYTVTSHNVNSRVAGDGKKDGKTIRIRKGVTAEGSRGLYLRS